MIQSVFGVEGCEVQKSEEEEGAPPRIVKLGSIKSQVWQVQRGALSLNLP